MNRPAELKISYEQAALSKVAPLLLDWGGDCLLWTFAGGLGAGKTTLIRALCTALGVTDRVTSPTFALVNAYRTESENIIYHMDWYRLNGAEEGYEAGLSELLEEPGARCFVEWPDKAEGLLPCRRITIEIEDAGSGQRTLLARRH